MVTVVSQKGKYAWLQPRLSMFASVKLTILLLVLTAGTVLVGAWCPQEGAVGKEKVVEQFGPTVAAYMLNYGIADIFHSPWFLGLIGLLTVNMVACSVQRVFPKVRSLLQPMKCLGQREIKKLAVSEQRVLVPVSAVPGSPADLQSKKEACIEDFAKRLKKAGYFVSLSQNRLTGHWGKIGRLAPTITHIGLLSLLAGVTVTSWTGFNGFQGVDLHDTMSFRESEHSKQWIGKLPKWHVRVDATRREDYEGGQPKQWYSTLTVIDDAGKVLKTQEISVNNPLTYDGVDIYQSSWGLHSINISFSGHDYKLPLQQMGPRVNAAFLPLDAKTIMIFSVRGQEQPVRVFAKVPEWKQPRILAVLPKGVTQKLGAVDVRFEEVIPATGLQYKSDPGLPITYVAFGFIIVGVMLAAIPYRQLWASVEQNDDGDLILISGGVSRKGKKAFERGLRKIMDGFAAECLTKNGSSKENAPSHLDAALSIAAESGLESIVSGATGAPTTNDAREDKCQTSN